jgi:hypothetical protein
VGVSPLAYLPGLDMRKLATIIGAKYATSVNRWTTMATGACTGLAAATGGELDRSALWRAGVKELPIVDILSAVLRDRFGCWGFIDLWRACGPYDYHGGGDEEHNKWIHGALSLSREACRNQAVGRSPHRCVTALTSGVVGTPRADGLGRTTAP